MKISLKVEYACRVMTQLAQTYGRNDLPHIECLSKAEAIPSNYLVQILNDLRSAGLIISRRGKQGGYALARHPRELTLGDVVRALEGEVLGLSNDGQGESAQRVLSTWKQIASDLEDQLNNVTIESLSTQDGDSMWYI